MKARPLTAQVHQPSDASRPSNNPKTPPSITRRTLTDFAVPALTKPTELQERAFALLGLRPHPAPALTEKGMTTAKPVQ